MLGWILLIVLILLLLGALPTYPYSRDWGYYPAGGIGIVLVIVLLLLLFGVFSPRTVLDLQMPAQDALAVLAGQINPLGDVS